jgi:hypothetical protein
MVCSTIGYLYSSYTVHANGVRDFKDYTSKNDTIVFEYDITIYSDSEENHTSNMSVLF